MPPISLEVKAKIIELRTENLTFSEIMKATGVTKSSISYILKKFTELGTIASGKSTGRPRKLTEREEKKLIFLWKNNPKATSQELLHLLNPTNIVSTGLIRQTLIKAKLQAGITVKKTLMTGIRHVPYSMQNFTPVPPNDDWLFDDEIVKYRKERMKAAKTAVASSSSRAGVSGQHIGGQVPGREYSESQEEAMAELAAALDFSRTSQTRAVPGDNDVTSVLDGSDTEEGGAAVLESTTIASSRGRGAKTSTRGTTKRGRGSRGGSTTGATSSGRGRAANKRAATVAGMTTLNLSMIAAPNPITSGNKGSAVEPQLVDSDDSEDTISSSNRATTAASRRTTSKRKLGEAPRNEEVLQDSDEDEASANVFGGRGTTGGGSRSNISQGSWNISQGRPLLSSAKLAKKF